MPEYLTPGVYVEEISMGARPIAAVGTRTAAFVGTAPVATAHVNEAVPISSWSQFVKKFVADDSPSTDLGRAVFGFFNNGGSRCYVVNVGARGSIAGDERDRGGLRALDPIDEVAMVAAPGKTDAASYEAVLSHCERAGDRFAILDAPQNVQNIDGLKQVATVDAPSGEAGGGETSGAAQSPALRPRSSDYGAFYFPWIVARDPLAPGQIVAQAPSGHLAGVYAGVDSTRGVHKAPANVPIRGAVGLNYRLTHEEQGELNRAGVNCIRYFSQGGIRVWGARTLADPGSEWTYLSVRRLFIMIRESIQDGTRWCVFEPNDYTLWQSIIRDVSAFLTLQWRAGALMGASPQEAFYVKCDAELNTPEVIDAGRVVIEIGIAPVNPAEFIIFQIGQWDGGATASV